MKGDWISILGAITFLWTAVVIGTPDRFTLTIWLVLAFFPLLRECGVVGPDPNFAKPMTHITQGERE